VATLAVTIRGTVTGLVEGRSDLSFDYTNSSSPGKRDLVTLTTTPVAVTIPANTLFVAIVPPSSNTTNILVSGAVGETTGAKLHPTNPTILPVPASSPNLYLFAATGTIADVQLYFL
jgi:hypothetical protein